MARPTSGTCVFYSIVAGATAADVVFEDDLHLAFLDVAPLFPGHVLVVPKRHAVTMADLEAHEIAPLFTRVRAIGVAVEGALEAGGTFIAMNQKVSQSVPHLHVHVVPRTKGDGLRGFFWPRKKYTSGDEKAAIRDKIAAALARD